MNADSQSDVRRGRLVGRGLQDLTFTALRLTPAERRFIQKLKPAGLV